MNPLEIHQETRTPFNICAWWNFHRQKRVERFWWSGSTKHMVFSSKHFPAALEVSSHMENRHRRRTAVWVLAGAEELFIFPLNFKTEFWKFSNSAGVCALCVHVWFTIKTIRVHNAVHGWEMIFSLERFLLPFRLHLHGIVGTHENLRMKMLLRVHGKLKTTNGSDTVRNGN